MKNFRFTIFWRNLKEERIATATWYWFICSVINIFTPRWHEP
jgi:hypothetical protein